MAVETDGFLSNHEAICPGTRRYHRAVKSHSAVFLRSHLGCCQRQVPLSLPPTRHCSRNVTTCGLALPVIVVTGLLPANCRNLPSSTAYVPLIAQPTRPTVSPEHLSKDKTPLPQHYHLRQKTTSRLVVSLVACSLRAFSTCLFRSSGNRERTITASLSPSD